MPATQERIREGVALAAAHIKEMSDHIEQLRLLCTHPDKTGECGGSSGNYDPSADAYWIDWHCPDCGKKWMTDQSRENLRQLSGPT